jgi:uncharacterized protein YqgV (UPF0045/DUF77 family)
VALLVEFTVEPFTEGQPGPHVQAALEAAKAAGGEVDFGPFGTSMSGEDAQVLAVVGNVVKAAVEAGATRVSLQVTRAD